MAKTNTAFSGIMQPLLNGHMYQFSSITFQVGGDLRIFDHITSLSYSATTERSTFYGTSKEPMGVTRGNSSYTASFTIAYDQLAFFLDDVTKHGVLGISDTAFNINISYSEALEEPLQNTQLLFCRINNVTTDASAGSEPLTATVELFVGRIYKSSSVDPKNPAGAQVLFKQFWDEV